MKKTCIIISMLVNSIIAHSQAFQSSYSYDANGNRISATIIWLKTALKNDIVADTSAISNSKVSESITNTIVQNEYNATNIDSLAGIKIAIYPNPTHGMIEVKLEGYNVSPNGNADQSANNYLPIQQQLSTSYLSQGSINVYNVSGMKIIQLSPLNQLNTIDLQSQSMGSYIMVIQLGSRSKTYTIIKN